LVPISAQRAQRIIVDSTYTLKDLTNYCKLIPDKLEMIPLAPDERFAPVQDSEQQEIHQKYNIKNKFILTVGNLQPRKNLPTLINAVVKLRLRSNLHIQLVIVGQTHWQAQAILDQANHSCLNTDGVRFLGYVPTEDLPALYCAAQIFAFPSLYEGFGLPPLEAMACGTPVVCSNAGALKEVVGDAGILLPPTDVDSWADTLKSILGNPILQSSLRQQGLIHAQTFSWKATAKKTLQVYEHTASLK
jgi:glycosyltransferase involved in cell wall biosynthesis